jgi:hypothetical protein
LLYGTQTFVATPRNLDNFFPVILSSKAVAVGGLEFIMDQRFADSDPAEDDGFLRAIKVLSTTSFGGEAKPSTHMVRFYGMLNIPTV